MITVPMIGVTSRHFIDSGAELRRRGPAPKHPNKMK